MISRKQKEVLFTQIQDRLRQSPALVICEYWGLNVGDLTQLRRELREVDGEFSVVKNRIFQKALLGDEFVPLQVLQEHFRGPVGVIYLRGDVSAGCKKVMQFSEQHEKFQIKIGFYEQSILSPQEIDEISKLPSKEELIAKILSSIVGVHRGVLGVLQGVPRNVVGVLSAIKETKQ